MSRIAFLLDEEEGHFLWTLTLAKELVSRGHSVCYFAPAALQRIAANHRFSFQSIAHATHSSGRLHFAALPLCSPAFASALRNFSPDVLVTLSIFGCEAIALRDQLPSPVVLLKNQFSRLSRLQYYTELAHLRHLTSPTCVGSDLRFQQARVSLAAKIVTH